MVRVLLVCMGNICRSPTAEGVLRRRIADLRLTGRVEVDSAGTHAYHIGEPPDPRARETAAHRGYDLSDLRARQVIAEDFETFDHILAMDRDNLAGLHRACPSEQRYKLRLFLELAPRLGVHEVPDPYYGDAGGFEAVLDMVEEASAALLDEIAG